MNGGPCAPRAGIGDLSCAGLCVYTCDLGSGLVRFGPGLVTGSGLKRFWLEAIGPKAQAGWPNGLRSKCFGSKGLGLKAWPKVVLGFK